MRSASSCLICLFLLIRSATAQEIRGVVRSMDKPVEFASVVLFGLDSIRSPTGSALTDSLGAFSIRPAAKGVHLLDVRCLGHVPYSDTLLLQAGINDLGVIELLTDTTALNEAEVTAMRKLLRRSEEGIVMEASDNLTQVGGSAADLLRNMPGVQVDTEGGITVRGRAPQVRIDGRISALSGMDRVADLERIPASSVQRIELITDPSARYDADSDGGVINITLKRGAGRGTSGAFGFGIGQGANFRLNGSALIEHGGSRWNMGAGADAWYTIRTREVNGDRTQYDVPEAYYLTQRRSDDRLVTSQLARAHADRELGAKGRLGFGLNWNGTGQDNEETVRNTYRDADSLVTRSNERFSNEVRRFNTVEFTADRERPGRTAGRNTAIAFSTAFADDQERTDIRSTETDATGEVLGESTLERTRNLQRSNLSSLAIDHARPLKDGLRLSTGYKALLRALDADIRTEAEADGVYAEVPERVDRFTFTELINAIHGQLDGSRGPDTSAHWNWQLGLRAEQVVNKATSAMGSAPGNNDYFNLFPSAKIKRTHGDASSSALSYGRRINRPGLGQLNPFIDITDSLNQYGGNPALVPELVDAIELAHDRSLRKGDLGLRAFYRRARNSIQTFTVLDSNGVAFSRPENFGAMHTAGGELLLALPVSKFCNVNISASLFQQWLNDPQLENELLAWYGKAIVVLVPWKSAKLQVAANYTAPVLLPQGKVEAVYFVDAGFTQAIAKGRGRIGITGQDIFRTMVTRRQLSSEDFTLTRSFRVDSRAVLFSLGWTFGGEFKEQVMENRFKND